MKTQKINQYAQFEEDPNQVVAIACSRSGDGCHTGLLIKLNGATKMLHFAFDKDLRFDERHKYAKDIIWVDFEFFNDSNDFEDNNKQILIALAHRVSKRNLNKIRYGISYNGDYFDDQGNLFLQSGTVGLTCATFLLAFFKGCFALDLLNYFEWPSREGDKKMQERLLNILLAENVDKEHLQRVESENIKARFLPEEVTAASASKDLPAGFEFCNSLGSEINRYLYTLVM